ncbi:MAG: PAS domain S-box protein, partial [Candidatus Zixiibacteriota bacterium]
INEAAKRMFGYEKDELVDLSTEVLHVDHEHYVEFGRRIQEAFDREEPASFEFEVKRKNGEIFPSQHTVTLLKNDIGESLGIVSVVRDVTERRRAERELNQYREHLEELVEERTAELKRANERLAREVTERKRAQEALRAEKEFTERALNAQTDTFFVFEPSTRRAVRWNKTFNKTSGYSDEEIRSMKAPDSYYGEEDLKKAAAAAEKILREGVATVELSLITKDGRSIPTEYTGSAITDDEGNPKYIIAVGRDVTDRKRAEQELHKRTYDLNERVKELNCLYLISNLVEKPGISLEEILQGTADLIPAAWEYPEIACARVILGGKIFRTDNFEETLWKQVTDITVHGNPVGSVGVCYLEERPEKDEGPFLADERNLLKAIAERLGRVVERTQAREEIQKLNESLKAQAKELAAANKELEAFSYSASHDLRAPLRTIDGFSRALLEDYPDKLDETGKDYLQRVRSATERMGQLIDDLLNLSLTMRREMRREEANLSHLASTVAADLQGTIPERQVEFVVQDEVLAHGDARLLRELLENLLGNAWKFTAKNSHPRIEFGITEKEGEEVYFVRDNGVGFDMTYADKLFVPFQRLHSDSEFSGNGIGLALVSRIINRHGGRIWAEGEVDKGASFYFTLQ